MRASVFLILFFLSCRQNVQLDSTPLYDLDNSRLVITDGENQFYLSRCQVFKNHDTISINFSDTSKHSNWYELQILKVKDKFLSNCKNTFSITDSSYKRAIFTAYHQIIKLSKQEYNVGDSIIGNVSLDISSYNQWPEIFTDTIVIKGDFRAVVQ